MEPNRAAGTNRAHWTARTDRPHWASGPNRPNRSDGCRWATGAAGVALADFVSGNGFVFAQDVPTLLLAKTVPAGNYVFVATVSGVGTSINFLSSSSDPHAVDTFCTLSDGVG